MFEMTFFELMQKGGLLMWPILACGFAAIVITIERLIYFYITSVSFADFRMILEPIAAAGRLDIEALNSAVEQKKLIGPAGKLQFIRWQRSPFYRLSRLYISGIGSSVRSREEALKRAGSEEIEKMERYLRGLSAIAHVGPLLGLMGTVTGIIAAFSVIAKMGGQVDVSALASGIWEALLTTVAGLAVAIPANLSYIYLEKKVSERTNGMSYTVAYLNEAYYKNNDSYAADSPGISGPVEPSGSTEYPAGEVI